MAPAPGSLVALLRATGTPPLRYLGRAILIAWLPAQAICFSLHFTYPGEGGFSFVHASLPTVLTGLIFGPSLETLLMRFFFFLIRQAIHRESLVNLFSAAIWGALHFHSVSWGLHAIWSFWVMGVCYLSYEKISVSTAMLMTAVIHMGFNTLSYVATLLLTR